MALLSRRASSAANMDARPPPSSSTPARKPSRKSSFMSLRKERSSHDTFPTGPARLQTPALPLRNSPSSSLSPSPIDPSPRDSDFTVSHSFQDLPDASLTPKIYNRNRSHASSNRPRPTSRVSIPDFRLSLSTQRTDTPPHTPTDLYSSPPDSHQDFSVLVAAPASSGVETIDALVDGMNGGDILSPHSVGMPARTTKFHHPLYHPPLPTPPPGVVLGGGTSRRQKRGSRSNPLPAQSSDEEDDLDAPTASPRHRRRRRKRPPPDPPQHAQKPARQMQAQSDTSDEEVPLTPIPVAPPTPKTAVPTISEIIRAHTQTSPQHNHTFPGKRSSSLTGHPLLREESVSDRDLTPHNEDTDPVSRSSIDSIAEEVQRTVSVLKTMKPAAATSPGRSNLNKRFSVPGDTNSLKSPSIEAPSVVGASSVRSGPATVQSGVDDLHLLSGLKSSQTQEVARYLRSARLTTLLKLTRFPHASPEAPLTVSLSDMGNPSGFPVVVFLGLGCVRHIMGLYDEMADCLNLRLICIDRWGLGRTEQRPKSAKGILHWTSVVDETLDVLGVRQCSIIAHSAGAPYALAFASRFPDRIRGSLCLLAPWVGGNENGGYKWLKYVPNGILKTAQAAEWKVQTWMLGKPPSLSYEGIGYIKSPQDQSSAQALQKSAQVYPHLGDNKSRPSISSTFSEYDDLGDFNGRFESKSTLGRSPEATIRANGEAKLVTKRKGSLALFDRFKPSAASATSADRGPPPRKLKALRSMGSLKGRSGSNKKSLEPPSFQLPPPLKSEVGFGLDDLKWSSKDSFEPSYNSPSRLGSSDQHSAYDRKRSLSLSTGPRPNLSMPSSPAPSASQSSFGIPSEVPSIPADNSFQAALGNALIAASHAESAKGTHSDLLQILNHDNQPWGFSYADYPHDVQVWYGDKDEKIAEHAVRWMERTMGPHRCSVEVVHGADHGLMYKSSVVVDVLEVIASFWRSDSGF